MQHFCRKYIILNKLKAVFVSVYPTSQIAYASILCRNSLMRELIILLTKFWGMFLRVKFFNKMFLMYTLIVVVALFVLAQIISGSTAASSIERDSRYDKLVLNNISVFLDQKEKVVLRIAQQAYSNSIQTPDTGVFDFLESDSDKSNQVYLQVRKRFIDYLSSAFSNDNDMTCVTMYKKLDETCYLVSKNTTVISSASSYENPSIIEQFNNYTPNVRLYSSSISTYSPHENVYKMAMNIKALDTYKNVGTLIVDFDVDGITKSMHQYYEDITSDILVVLDDGSILYDSSSRFNGRIAPDSELLKGDKPRLIINGQECIVNRIENKDLNITVIGILPVDKALQKISNARRNIFYVSFICILAVLILTYMTTKVFSRRINAIMSAIRKIRQGDLKTRIHSSKLKDEFYEISEGMNKMCTDLENHISQVYISEIKQKSAELLALQAQINPHFLYNTLEAIRMKANTCGAKEAGEMIFILSKMFRNVTKENAIIDINEELDSSLLYLKLFEIRYGNRLTVSFDIDSSILKYGIIRHVLQPIIENYIVHGFDSSSENNSLCIKVYKNSEYIYLSVNDNGRGMDEDRLAMVQSILRSDCPAKTDSIGLANVNERIKIIFGPECGLDIYSNHDKGTTVNIKIFAKTVEELKLHV